ncbi:MAG: hypothetical protein JOZ75_04060 [Candidatus Dormibacteraeota bacterium]|nr:hypothetical protein [Candidatus Dormibacteraeota bacterium]
MLDPGLVTLIVVVVVAGAAPVFGVFLWNARHRLSEAARDARAHQAGGRSRLGTGILVYGFATAIFLTFGALSLLRGGYVVGAILIALGLAYGAAMYAGILGTSRRSEGRR